VTYSVSIYNEGQYAFQPYTSFWKNFRSHNDATLSGIFDERFYDQLNELLAPWNARMSMYESYHIIFDNEQDAMVFILRWS
jgi:hypothetical protein